MSNAQYVDNYFNDMIDVINRIDRESIEKVIDILYDAWRNNKQIFVIGNGGSASTATHFACDLAKCTIVENKKRVRVVSLTDNIPLVSALTNDDGFEAIFEEQLKNLMNNGDVLIGISVHGGTGKDKAGLWSQNLLRAIDYVKQRDGMNIGLSGFDGGVMKDVADACVVVPVNSTPQVESLHLALAHLISNCLREKIERFSA